MRPRRRGAPAPGPRSWRRPAPLATPFATRLLHRLLAVADSPLPTASPGLLGEGGGPCQMAAHAAKKRRPEEEEAEEEVHLAFRGAANALSQVYAHAVAHQKASFVAGERRAMENVHQWLSSQLEEASEVPVAAVLAYLQNEIEHRREDPVASPQHPSQQQTHNTPSTNVQCNPFSFGNIAAALDYRMDETDQTSNSAVPNSLPDPLRQNFHSNHLIQSSGCGPINSCPNGNGPRNNQSPQNLDSVNCNLTEPSMDMHCDGP